MITTNRGEKITVGHNQPTNGGKNCSAVTENAVIVAIKAAPILARCDLNHLKFLGSSFFNLLNAPNESTSIKAPKTRYRITPELKFDDNPAIDPIVSRYNPAAVNADVETQSIKPGFFPLKNCMDLTP